MLVISIESEGIAEFTLTRNIIHISSMKCKKVTCAMLALKLYAIIARINILIALSNIINMITNKLKIRQLLIIICINSFLLYKCIIKLGTIKEKRLIINIILIC